MYYVESFTYTLFQGIKHSTTLIELNLTNHNLLLDGYTECLTDALQSNNSLKKIVFEDVKSSAIQDQYEKAS